MGVRNDATNALWSVLDEGRTGERDCRAMAQATEKALEFLSHPDVFQALRGDPEMASVVGGMQHRAGYSTSLFRTDAFYKTLDAIGRYDLTIWMMRWVILALWAEQLDLAQKIIKYLADKQGDSAGQPSLVFRALAQHVQKYYGRAQRGLAPWPYDIMTRPADVFRQCEAAVRTITKYAEITNTSPERVADAFVKSLAGKPLAEQTPEALVEFAKGLKEEVDYATRADIAATDREGGTGTIIVKYNDGSAWVELGDDSCDLEGELMHHCGACSGTLYSLRFPVENAGRQSWKPVVTACIDGTASQIRGKQNSSPPREYWSKIADLLIKVHASGLESDCGIGFDDFSTKDQKRILASNPNFEINTEECYSCETKIDAEDAYPCDGCSNHFCGDCLHRCPRDCDVALCERCLDEHEKDEHTHKCIDCEDKFNEDDLRICSTCTNDGVRDPWVCNDCWTGNDRADELTHDAYREHPRNPKGWDHHKQQLLPFNREHPQAPGFFAPASESTRTLAAGAFRNLLGGSNA